MMNLSKMGNLPQSILTIIAVIGVVIYIGKHFREWLEFFGSNRYKYLETLKTISEDIKNVNYLNAYKNEEKYIFFTLLTKRKIYSAKKRELLLNLLNKEIITKNDIKKYSYHFKECNGKLKIDISFSDKLEMWFLRFLALYLFTASVVILFALTQENFISSYSILAVLIGIILLGLALGAFNASFKINRLKDISKEIKNSKLYSEKC